jgi:multiple sugar transport system substrate-binding protein
MTTFNRRQLLGLGLGAAAAVTLAACGDDDKGPAATGNGGKDYTGPKVTVNLWNGFTGGDGDIFKKLVDQFNT